MSFLVSVLASLAAGAILLVGASLLSKYVRWLLVAILGRLVHVDIDDVFRNKAEAASDIKTEIERARHVYILTSRGNELQRDTFTPIFAKRPESKLVAVRIILPATELSDAEYDWVQQREKELASFDPAFGAQFLKQQIRTNMEFLKPYGSEGKVELRALNFPHVGRIIVTDRAAYFTPYRADAHGSECPVIKYRSGGDMYNSCKRRFDLLWEAAVAVALPGHLAATH